MIIDNRLFYIHIPRCAGRFVRELMITNGYPVSHYKFYDKIKTVDKVFELSHLHYPLYNEVLPIVKNMPHIAVVRNPLDRFHSALKAASHNFLKKELSEEVIRRMSSGEYFFNFIEKATRNNEGNWFRPQSEFISDKTHIWKFEEGFGESFFSWLENFEIDIKIKSSPVPLNNKYDNKSYPNEWAHLVYKFDKHVKKYYEKDYEKFKYEPEKPAQKDFYTKVQEEKEMLDMSMKESIKQKEERTYSEEMQDKLEPIPCPMHEDYDNPEPVDDYVNRILKGSG